MLMLKFIITIIIFYNISIAAEGFSTEFITEFEYGKMLYEKPRGISCAKCHGDDAKGMTVSSFTHKTKKNRYECVIATKDITNISYEEFLQTLDPNIEKPKKKFSKDQVCEKMIYGNVMPTYFLTQEELKSIHLYLTTKEQYEE